MKTNIIKYLITFLVFQFLITPSSVFRGINLHNELSLEYSPSITPTPLKNESKNNDIIKNQSNTQTQYLDFDSALSAYSGIASKAIESADRALNYINWVIGTFIALCTSVTGLGVWLSKVVTESKKNSQSALDLIKRTESLYSELEKKIVKMDSTSEQLMTMYQSLQGKTTSLEQVYKDFDLGKVDQYTVLETIQQTALMNYLQDTNNFIKKRELEVFASNKGGLLKTVEFAIELQISQLKKKSRLGKTDKKIIDELDHISELSKSNKKNHSSIK